MMRNCQKSCKQCTDSSGTTSWIPHTTATPRPTDRTTATTTTERITTSEPPITVTLTTTKPTAEPPTTVTLTTTKPTSTATTTVNTTIATDKILTITTPEPSTTTTSRPSTTIIYIPPTQTASISTTTRKPVRLLPKPPVISVTEITPDAVRFQVTFRRDGSTPTLLIVKPFQRELKYKNVPIEFTDGTPQVIEVKFSGLKPESAYSFRFYALSDAGSGQYIDEKIMTKAKATRNTSCGNNYPDDKCQRLETKWKFCRLHRVWMSRNCKETCGLCPVQRDEPTTGRTGDPNCQDADKYCRDWSRFGHCQTNASYMLNHCKVACRVCKPAV